ncbi:BnaC05g23370D [Brassica napus]|uniref:BnaC05g23370D protein n=1 Tax=Brassica napus TaxID=3708 RepID=A0A078F951_BRANA|nr:BnaC05g23370D [Brassica napus]
MYRASVVSVFPCEEGCCVDELWRLDNALRSRSGKTEQRHRVHFTFKRSHWSMHSTWKLWAQDLPEQESSKASLPSLLLFDKFHYIYVESRIGSQCLMDPITPCT